MSEAWAMAILAAVVAIIAAFIQRGGKTKIIVDGEEARRARPASGTPGSTAFKIFWFIIFLIVALSLLDAYQRYGICAFRGFC